MWWPFRKKKKLEDLFLFSPKEDITASECEQFIDDLTPYRFVSERYVESLPKQMKRHFKKIQIPETNTNA